MKQKVKAVLRFDGSDFFGWQIQNQTSPTVQEFFNKALSKVYKQEVHTLGSGRTDAGVHSLDHHVVFQAPFEIPLEKLTMAINSHLPESMRVFSCSNVATKFRPTNDAIKKEYRYIFSNEKIVQPMMRKYMANLSYDLNIDQMKKAAQIFVGEHDFEGFMCTGSDPSSTIRTIFECEVYQEESCFQGIIPRYFVVRVVGNGFLKQMVRLMVGSIWAVGRGKLSVTEIQQQLANPGKKHLSAVAPATGLFKYSVQY